MQKIREQEILGRELRANPQYELVLFDRLEPDLRQALASLEKEPGFYGVLRPAGEMRAGGFGLKAGGRGKAPLFLPPREPGRPPGDGPPPPRERPGPGAGP